MNQLLENLAAVNKNNLITYYDELLSDDKYNKEDQLKFNQFFNCIQNEKKIGINVELLNLSKILEAGQYINIFELGYSEENIKQHYNREVNYYKRLNHFVNKFDEHRIIKYAALNVGDLGTNYPAFGKGRICMILNNSILNELHPIICLKYFSLKYFKDDGSFREDDFKMDVSKWSVVEYLALNKHKDDVLNASFEAVPKMISNGNKGWLEILISSNISTTYFESIRMHTEYYNDLKKVAESNQNDLDEMDKMKVVQFNYIVKKCNDYNIKIDVYDY